MKRTIVSVLLLLILAGLVYVIRQKYGKSQPTPTLPQETSHVQQLLQQGTSDTADTETTMEVPIDNLDGYNYEGGGDYKPFFPQTVKDALSSNKDVILYFYANRDPTDKALDLDLQKRKERIPKNTIILRVDYDANQKLRDAFSVKQQNTLIWLNKEGTETTRRSMGITTLSQIVRVRQ